MTVSSKTEASKDPGLRSTETIVEEIRLTRLKLSELEDELRIKNSEKDSIHNSFNAENSKEDSDDVNYPLRLEEYTRYGRQMILPEVGLPGQLKLKSSSVLVIGAGGLGCPALLYLSRAGVGKISIVDHDLVELSNLHRQVLHNSSTVGMNKAESAKIGLLAGNPCIEIKSYPLAFTAKKIRPLSQVYGADPKDSYLPDLTQFDVVLDCTDNPGTRYLISDACVAHGTPLVSGAAIRNQGQLSSWNLPPSGSDKNRGPCYRCVFKEDRDIQGERCADEGVMGPAVGVVGVLMAWEAIRILLGIHDLKPKLLLIPSFRTVKLRDASPKCPGCGPGSKEAFWKRVCDQSSTQGLPSVPCGGQMCQIRMSEKSSARSIERITTDELLDGDKRLENFHLVDVRSQTQFGICSLPNSINIPLSELSEFPELKVKEALRESNLIDQSSRKKDILFICRRGVDSLIAAEMVSNNKNFSKEEREETVDDDFFKVFDLVGGLEAYSRKVDQTFPVY